MYLVQFPQVMAIQAVSSQAIATSSHQIWFCAKPCSGRFRRPVSFAQRMRSSHLARRRWRSSRSASCPVLASAAKQGDPVPADVGEPQLGAGSEATGPASSNAPAWDTGPGRQQTR
jgi:hypothetical protein